MITFMNVITPCDVRAYMDFVSLLLKLLARQLRSMFMVFPSLVATSRTVCMRVGAPARPNASKRCAFARVEAAVRGNGCCFFFIAQSGEVQLITIVGRSGKQEA